MYILPSPKELTIKEEQHIIKYYSAIIIDKNCNLAVNSHATILKNDILKNIGFVLPVRKGEIVKNSIYLAMDSKLAKQEYILKIDKHNISIFGGSDISILYGIQTLRQLISQKGAVLPCLIIKDYPDMENRGFYHDVTRGRIPTLSYLKALADKLSYYKINQLQLYIEQSFLFQDFSEVWRDDTPLTPEEIMELDSYCRKLGIELVPSLSSFGHLYKVLSTKTYGHLCELKSSEKKPFSFKARMQHHTLDISNEESFEFVKKMIEEFMPLFSSKHFNICADETFDLGKGRSKELADEIGVKNMYIGFVKKLCDFIVSKGRIPMFWGDIISGFPKAIRELPKETICLNWGYAPNQRENEIKALYEAGAAQYVCPGVGGWNQFINLIESSYENIKRMCEYGYKYNAVGVLNTDWGDFGHVNHPEFSTAGMIYGAAFSWNKEIPSFEEINRQISLLEFKDQREQFMSIVAEISTLSVYKWEFAIRFMEMKQLGVADEFFEEHFAEFHLKKVQQVNETLQKRMEELYRFHLIGCSKDRKNLIKPYLVAGDGIYLFNLIGAVIDQIDYKRDHGIKKDPSKLAIKLEYWLYHYKEVWRSVSKESELYRIQDVIIWYADYLRGL